MTLHSTDRQVLSLTQIKACFLQQLSNATTPLVHVTSLTCLPSSFRYVIGEERQRLESSRGGNCLLSCVGDGQRRRLQDVFMALPNTDKSRRRFWTSALWHVADRAANFQPDVPSRPYLPLYQLSGNCDQAQRFLDLDLKVLHPTY